MVRGRKLKEKETTMSNAETEAALDTGVKNRRPSLIAYQVREGKDDQSYWDRCRRRLEQPRRRLHRTATHAIPLDGRIVLTKPKNNG